MLPAGAAIRNATRDQQPKMPAVSPFQAKGLTVRSPEYLFGSEMPPTA